MGLDVSYQAMPADAGILERAKRDPDFAELLGIFSLYATISDDEIEKESSYYALEPEEAEFISEARQLAAKHPGLEKRKLFWGRKWDVIHYLLSPYRRSNGPRHPSDWVADALFGHEVANKVAANHKSFHVHYLSPTQTKQVLGNLRSITPESLRLHWNVQAMREARVYKMHTSEDDESFEWLFREFEILRSFYREVASHDEGVLSFMV